jgi:2-iminobutanoate/2-iminopropanoate deaminase
MKEQTRMTMEYIKAILEEANSSMDHVVKINTHITDHSLFAVYNEIYKQYFSIPFPARTTVVSGLAEGMLIEIDAIAKIKS